MGEPLAEVECKDCPNCTNGWYTLPDGSYYKCWYCDAWSHLSERARVERLVAESRAGLRRIGVTVALWAAMARAERHARGQLRMWRNLAIDTGIDLAAERAKLRRWQLRLRWRRTRHDIMRDRLAERAEWQSYGYCVQSRDFSRAQIAGPRGVLP